MSGSLTTALNGRKGKGKIHAIPVDFDVEPILLLQEAPARPALEVVEGQRVRGLPPRELRAGEVGHRAGPIPVEYTEAALRTALTRTAKGCNYISEHVNDEDGAAQMGLLVELTEDLNALLRLHMARGVLQ